MHSNWKEDYSTMANTTTKKLFAGLLALSAGVILASCDPISAIPASYNDPILKDVDVEENKIGTIYDAVATEKNAKIVENILREIAEAKFGTYKEYKAATASGSYDDAAKAYTKKYSKYFGKTEEIRENRFNQFVKDVKARINEFFYNEVSNASYQDELGRFSEEKLYNDKRYDLYDLDKIEDPSPTDFETFFVDKTVDKTNAYNLLAQKEAYEATSKRGYIKEKVYPDILKDKLVEDYVYRKNYNALGRAYAREVNMIKLTYEGKNPFTRKLAENFATKHIEQLAYSENTKAIKFEHLANAYKGFAPSTDDDQLIDQLSLAEDALFTGVTTEKIEVKAADIEEHYTYQKITLVPAGEYYVETKLGQILKDYKDAIDGEKAGRFPTEVQKTALDSFTSDGKSKEHGLFNKIVDLMKEDYTTDGWNVKSSGLGDLTSALKDRLFNIRVSQAFDDPKAILNETYNELNPDESTIGKWMYEMDAEGKPTDELRTRLPYIRSINGRKVVIPAKPSYKDRSQNYVYDDVDGKSITICQVSEAPSTAKLNKDKTTEYDTAKKELLARSIAKVLGTKDSYIKDAYTEVLNKYDFAFYDSSLYDYLKSEYPDLDIFDED